MHFNSSFFYSHSMVFIHFEQLMQNTDQKPHVYFYNMLKINKFLWNLGRLFGPFHWLSSAENMHFNPSFLYIQVTAFLCMQCNIELAVFNMIKIDTFSESFAQSFSPLIGKLEHLYIIIASSFFFGENIIMKNEKKNCTVIIPKGNLYCRLNVIHKKM